MAIPAGITTALVHMDAPLSFIGEPGRLHVEILPSVSLVWAETGTPVVNFEDMMDLADGQALEILLPHTDQDGFLDGAGNTITGWYYTVRITYEKDGQNRVFPERDFQVLTGQDEVDLALVPAGEAAVPSVAPILTVTSIEGFTGPVSFVELGLDLVDNVPDADKPVSGPQLAALNLKADIIDVDAALALKSDDADVVAALALKAPLNNPTFTGTVSGVSRAMVGLGNADNTSDVNKPVSTATATALAGKAATVHRHTYADIDGTVPTAALPPLAINETFTVTSQAAMLALTAQRGDMAIRTDIAKSYVLATDSPATLADWKEFIATGQVVSVAGKTGVVSLVKADVGLGSVDNTTDLAKPISTLTQAALDGKAAAPGAWTALVLEGAWVPYAAGGGYYNGLRYRIGNGYVEVQGMVKSGALGSIISTLPVGARPTYSRLVQVTSGGATRTSSWLIVSSDGTVTYDTGVAAPAYVEIYFRVPLN